MEKFPDSDENLVQERQNASTEKLKAENKPEEVSEEQPVESLEEKLEQIPTIEEVSSVIKELVGEKEYIVVRQSEDEKGLYLYEVKIPGNSEGEEIGYEYMEKGHYKEGESSATEIHKVYYENGEAVGGTSAARYIDGKWIIL
ncbi:MAG: hypothetical protein WC306_00505 [Candidatus Paceibacterota bacterium]|jgi:hypothetical protein